MRRTIEQLRQDFIYDPVKMHEVPDDCAGHVCIYLLEGEVHFDLPALDEPLTVEEFALAIASATYEFVTDFYKQVQDHAQSHGSSIQ